MKAEYAGYAWGCLYSKKGGEVESVAGQFAAVKYKSETYCWTQKQDRQDYGVDKYWVIFLSGWDLKLAGWDYDF